MAKSYTVNISAHRNVYNNNLRTMNLYFSEPEQGVNKETGLLLFIAGYGGHANSNVYKKMRDVFADQYNLVCIQCDYFGWEFMQHEELEESIDNFNDMTTMQALDNLTAVTMVIEILKDNNLDFNGRRIIAYGHSHGAYLTYLCNRLSPGLFSSIIDNSSYNYPMYLHYGREISGGSTLSYLAGKTVLFPELYDLVRLYDGFDNRAQILSWHGENDDMAPIEDKERLCAVTKGMKLERVRQEHIRPDGAFTSTRHGLNADFLKMFDLAFSALVDMPEPYTLDDISIQVGRIGLHFSYNSGLIRLDLSNDGTLLGLLSHSIQDDLASAIDKAMKYGSVSQHPEEQRAIAGILVQLERVKEAFRLV
ncbi:hypothetical protein DFQ01_101419 [Paenibacillus cellulosilyticus]|uniref:DUF2920 family protein n=1 Tax=Paenibacillus cellulosilyticus TaxID=375489 RepID=A0A2V2Z088_9BACL|nr:DUF2920 family protein [Paenibacillus cellulosilyticus]PWW08693.1 hypothetical protein DFQ01_101419 [Paenibacillus cellulosilyticus]QKS48259.1 DUF2920 family protein [Paenibacillus cellulosilyticus]